MKTQEQVLKELFELAEDIGMNVFFNSENEEDRFNGFIIGTEDYFMNVMDGTEELDNYDKVIGIEVNDNKREGMH